MYNVIASYSSHNRKLHAYAVMVVVDDHLLHKRQEWCRHDIIPNPIDFLIYGIKLTFKSLPSKNVTLYAPGLTDCKKFRAVCEQEIARFQTFECSIKIDSLTQGVILDYFNSCRSMARIAIKVREQLEERRDLSDYSPTPYENLMRDKDVYQIYSDISLKDGVMGYHFVILNRGNVYKSKSGILSREELAEDNLNPTKPWKYQTDWGEIKASTIAMDHLPEGANAIIYSDTKFDPSGKVYLRHSSMCRQRQRIKALIKYMPKGKGTSQGNRSEWYHECHRQSRKVVTDFIESQKVAV